MKQYYDRFYLFRVWALCLVLAPFIFFMIGFIHPNKTLFKFEDLLFLLLIFFVCSLALSMPGLLISHLIYYFINSKHITKNSLKVIISLISIFMIFLTFYFVDGRDAFFSFANFSFPLSYCISLFISVFVCKLRENNDN